jgi:hypothetical protein
MALAGTTNHVERIVSAYRRAAPVAVERERAQHDRRSLFHRVDDGSVLITVRLPAEAGATVLSAIEHLVAPSVAEPDGTRDPLSARRADALVDLAIAGHAASGKRGSATRYLAHLHLSRSALIDVGGRCEIHGHGDSLDQPIGISIDTALRMLCDADIDIVLAHADADTRHFDHRQGAVRGMRRRQVEQRDDHRCQVPGCARHGHLEVHHIKHRAHKGNNTLPNLTMLCRFHHHRLHEGGWTAVRTPDGLELHDPHGRRICSRPPITTGDCTAVAAHDRKPADGRCQWGGERLDINMASTPCSPAPTLPRESRSGRPDGVLVPWLSRVGISADCAVTTTYDSFLRRAD